MKENWLRIRGGYVITNFRLINLRSIADSGSVQIKRINILVGRNSSGKSTLLRALPLLRQSVEQPTKGPILWYGRLVDFGSFSNAARDGNTDRGIELEFDLNLTRRMAAARRLSAASGRTLPVAYGGRSQFLTKVNLLLGRSPKDQVGKAKVATIAIGQDNIEVRYGDSRIVVTALGKQVQLGVGKEWFANQSGLFPALTLLHTQSFAFDDDEPSDRHEYLEPAPEPFAAEIVMALRRIAHGRTSEEKLAAVARRMIYMEASAFHHQLVRLPGISDDLRFRFRHLGPTAPEITELRRYVLLSQLDSLTAMVNEELVKFATSVRYIEPLRASAERYYRQQDLSVDEIDSRGGNTAMFLGSLSEFEMQSLQQWMEENLGFKVVVESDVGHVQIKIAAEDGLLRNIADLGFGYSQVLPIVLQLWRSTVRRTGMAQSVVAMEQPELHLHPEYQARLADIIASVSQGNLPSAPRIFLETHSDHLINRIGALVADGRIPREHVQVLVVSKNVGEPSEVTPVEFDEEGRLDSRWPMGFFTPGLR